MKILFALPGFYRFDRGAEVALLSVADAMADAGDAATVIGSGAARPGAAYHYEQVGAVSRERFGRFPFFPPFRSEQRGRMRRLLLVSCGAVISCSRTR